MKEKKKKKNGKKMMKITKEKIKITIRYRWHLSY